MFPERIATEPTGDTSNRDRDELPLVSVAVPLYKPELRYVREMVSALVAQDCRPLEVVLSDDASGAEVDWVDSSLGDGITYARHANAERLGMVGNWNAAVNRTSGALVIVLHQDDFITPTGLRVMRDTLAADPTLVAVGVAPHFIDEDGRLLVRKLRVNHRMRLFQERRGYRLTRNELTYLTLRNGQVLGEPSAVMFRREAFRAIGGYDARYAHAADVDFTLRLAGHGDVVYINEPFLRRRWHRANLTHRNRAEGVIARDRRQLYDTYADRLDRTQRDRVRAAMLSYMMYDVVTAVRHGNLRDVLSLLSLGDAWRVSLRALMTRVRELWSGHNLDRC